MRDRLLGLETEYALTALGRNGEPLDRTAFLCDLVPAARRRFATLLDGVGGVFLENGSRFYVDCGGHPEVSTPECTRPDDAVCFAKAGDCMLLELARGLEQARPGTRVVVLRNNVDYSGSRTTWGSHESHLCTSDPEEMPAHLTAHLVTRTVYAGAGGFDPLQPGLEFVVSPRSFYIERSVSADSTANRAIFHTRDEPLSSSGHHRLHLLCGESLGSETALWLRLGTTSLLVALRDHRVTAGRELQLRDPRAALWAVARDPYCRVRLALLSGETVTAVEVQRRYLALVESRLDEAWMPTWAPELCRAWRLVLESLDRDPRELARVLDWPLKRMLFARHANACGITWEQLEVWTDALRRVSAAFAAQGMTGRELPAATILASDSPARSTVEALRGRLAAHGLGWDGLEAYFSLRDQLLELDTRFGELGTGVFATLDSGGELDHRVVDPAAVASALDHPPGGRAGVRGAAIRACSDVPDGSGIASWQGVWDLSRRRFLDLGNPFERSELWRPLDGPGVPVLLSR